MEIFEKMGTPNIIKYIIDDNIKNIITSINNSSILKISINNRKLKADIYINFLLSSNYKGSIDYNNCISSDFKNCNIKVNYINNYDLSNVLKTLTHELTHIYELYNVKDIIKTTKWKWQDALNNTKKQDNYGLIKYLRDVVYLSLPQELNARVSSIYFFLSYQCNSSMSKQDMIIILKKSNEWMNYLNLIDFSPNDLFKGFLSYYGDDIYVLYYMLNELNYNIGFNITIENDTDLKNYLDKLDKRFKKSAKTYKVKLFKVLNRIYTEVNKVTENIQYDEPDDVSYEKYLKLCLNENKDKKRNDRIDNLLEYKEYITDINDMKYIKLFENYNNTDEVIEYINHVFYEFTDLKVDISVKNEDFKIIIQPKILTRDDDTSPDFYKYWNYFEIEGDLKDRINRLFHYMWGDNYTTKISYRFVKDEFYINDDFARNRIKEYEDVYINPNTPREILLNNLANDQKLIKLEINFIYNP